jgi:hypothetical protein
MKKPGSPPRIAITTYLETQFQLSLVKTGIVAAFPCIAGYLVGSILSDASSDGLPGCRRAQ